MKASIMTSLYSCEDEEVLKQVQKLLFPDCSVSTNAPARHFNTNLQQMDAGAQDVLLQNGDMKCDTCGEVSLDLRACGACEKAFYCTIKCQRTDWNKSHKDTCRKKKKKSSSKKAYKAGGSKVRDLSCFSLLSLIGIRQLFAYHILSLNYKSPREMHFYKQKQV